MSSSFLKPSVTPATAFATRLRARPWNLPSPGSSVARVASSRPSASAKVMPAGCACRSWPFGPLTSTAPSTTFTVTPLGIAMGFLPIRDISRLPDVAEHFAADAGLHGRAAGHDAARRRQDARTEPREHVGHVLLAEIDAAAGPADALDAGDEALAVRAVLQEQPQRLVEAAPAGRLELLEALDVALVLQDAGDLGLQPRRGYVDARVLRGHRVANPCEHVCDRVSHCYLFEKAHSS